MRNLSVVFLYARGLVEGVVQGIELRGVNDRSFTFLNPDPDPLSCMRPRHLQSYTLGGLG
jgi:hypothetical protein